MQAVDQLTLVYISTDLKVDIGVWAQNFKYLLSMFVEPVCHLLDIVVTIAVSV